MARTPPVRTAGQVPLIAGVALVVLLGGLVAQGDDARRPVDGSAEVQDQADQGITSVSSRVGPPTATPVEQYVADRTTAMQQATDIDVAVVSFSELVTAKQAVDLVGADVVVVSVMLRVPLETARPVVIRAEGDAVSAASDALAQLAGELAEEEQAQRRLLESDTLNDAAFEQDARDQAEALAAARGAAIGGQPLVHAVVVRGPLQALQALQQLPQVRLVDPAPPGTDPATSVFHGLLPSDTETVRFGRAG